MFGSTVPLASPVGATRGFTSAHATLPKMHRQARRTVVSHPPHLPRSLGIGRSAVGAVPWEPVWQSKAPASTSCRTTVGNPGAQGSCSPAEAQQGKVQRSHGAAAAGWAGEVRLRAGVGTCAVAQAAARQLAEGAASEIAGDCGWCGKVGPQLGNEQHPNWWGAWQRVPVVGERVNLEHITLPNAGVGEYT